MLDAFSGSGTTGMAAKLCDRPTDRMVKLADELGVEPVWGPRDAILYDISTYGCFAAEVMADPPDPDEFASAVAELVGSVDSDLGRPYEVSDDLGDAGTLRHAIWSSVLECPHCGGDVSFYDAMVTWDPLSIGSEGTCPECGGPVSTRTCRYVTEDVWDSIVGTTVNRRRRVPVLLYGETGGRKWRRVATPDDVTAMLGSETSDYPDSDPKPIVWGELHRSGYHHGMTHLHHFYTRRNFRVMDALWRGTDGYPGRVGDALRLLLLGYNSSNSTLMTRVIVKRQSRDFVLSGSQSGVLYVSNLPVEKNILRGVGRKVEPFRRAFETVRGLSGSVTVRNMSSGSMVEPDGSVDYVFTDPPFGDYIPYAEVNQINELWLGRVTDRGPEAVVSPSQGKGVSDYSELIRRSLSECRRVLRDGGLMTLVFNSSSAEVRKSFRDAIGNAGLTVLDTSSLSRTQDSFKKVVDPGAEDDSVLLVGKSPD